MSEWAVVGAGQTGAGIPEVAVRAGVDVLIYEPTEALVEAGRARITKSMECGVSKGNWPKPNATMPWHG